MNRTGRPGKSWAPLRAAARIAPALQTAAALFFINALLSAELPVPGGGPLSALRVSPEALGLFFGLCLMVRSGARFRPALYFPLAAGLMFLGLFASADRLVPAVFNRDFNLYMDAQRLPDLIRLFRLTRPPAEVLLGLAAGAAAAAALAWALWRALRVLHTRLAHPAAAGAGARMRLAAVSAALLFAPQAFGPPDLPPLKDSALPRVAAEIRFILDLDDIRRGHRSAIRAAADRAERAAFDLGGLEGASVFLFVVESYGLSAFSDPRHAGAVLPAARAAEAALRSEGFAVCSAYLASPTFGGGSWLAHATLASGVHVDSQIRHDLLLASDLVPLAGHFNRAGYRTVRAMPGTRWPWPEGAFYAYRETWIAPDFGYRGPAFGFAPMPDQFVLDRLGRRAVQGAPGPLFAEVILTGSHAAFDVQAPYVEDWEAVGDGAVFAGLAPVRFPVGWADLAEAGPAYSAAIAHQIRLLADFIRRFLQGRELAVIVGDHQPCVELTGRGQPWSVPVHVISRNPELIAGFTRRGYAPGLVPAQPPPHPGMETLFWDLLEEGSAKPPRGRPPEGPQ